MARPFAVCGFSLLAALALLFSLPEWCVFPLLALAAAALILSLCVRKRHEPTLAAAAASVLFACLLMLAQLNLSYYPAQKMTGEHLQIRAAITSGAVHQYNRYYYETRLISVNGEAKSGKLRLTSRYPIYADPYDEIEYTGKVYLLGEDDPELRDAYKAKGVYLGTYPEGFAEDSFTVIKTHSLHPMKYVLLLQKHMQRTLYRTLSPLAAGITQGIFFGDKSAIPWAVQQNFRAAGVTHLFSVSGLHMSLLSYGFLRLLRALRIKEKPRAIVSCVFVIFLMALTGFSSSCVRAGILMLFLLAGNCFSRKPDSLNSLGLAALVLLLINPLAAGQAGLQLSFAATLGILLFQRRLRKPIDAALKKRPKLKKLFSPAADSLCVTASVLLLTLPVSLLRLPGGVSLIVFPANLIFVPLTGLLLPLGGLCALFGAVPLLGKPLVFFTELLAQILVKGAAVIARLPAPALKNAPWLPVVFAAALALAAFALWRRYKNRPVPLRYMALAMAALLTFGGWFPSYIYSQTLRVEQIDTGMYIVTQGSLAALIGCSGETLPARSAKNALIESGSRGFTLLLLPQTRDEAALREILRDIEVRTVVYTEKAPAQVPLWDNLVCIYTNEVCRIENTE